MRLIFKCQNEKCKANILHQSVLNVKAAGADVVDNIVAILPAIISLYLFNGWYVLYMLFVQIFGILKDSFEEGNDVKSL